MPSYDKPMRIRVDRAAPVVKTQQKVAAVIQFTAGPEELDRINAFLLRLQERGIIERAMANTYDPEITSPELFFP